MPFTIVVLIKQVPDRSSAVDHALNDHGMINREALPAICNPEDLQALEMALAVKDYFGATVTVLTMGPPQAAEALREALYLGADRTILLTDTRFAGSDTLATASALSRAVQKLGTPDLLLCGSRTLDSATGQVGPQVAEQLGINQLTSVEKIEKLDSATCRCWREAEDGRELAESKLPLLVTVTGAAAAPRPFSAKRIMRFKSARAPAELKRGQSPKKLADRGLLIEQWGADEIGIDPSRCGLSGSPTRVLKIDGAAPAARPYKKIGADDQAIRELLEQLMADTLLG